MQLLIEYQQHKHNTITSQKTSTCGSPVLGSVWIKSLPMETSLQTRRKPVSIVPPARRIDTPQIYNSNGLNATYLE